MNVELPPAIEAQIKRKIEHDGYSSPQQVIEEAMTALQIRDELEAADSERLRQLLQVGIDQADRGECTPFDVNEIIAKARAEHAEWRRRHNGQR